MAFQFSAAACNALLDSFEATVGTAPLLRLYSGTKPAAPATALSGNTLLAEGALPSDWMAAATGAAKGKAGTWSLTGQSGAGSGTAATFFRLYDAAGSACHLQGTVTGTGGGGDLVMDNVSVANAQAVTVSAFSLVVAAGNQ